MIYKARLIPESLMGRVLLAYKIYEEDAKKQYLKRIFLITSGIEPQTVASRLITIMYGE